ncbi:MAG TPA: EamA family transporter [Planctomycetota bacterium]|nr:EamA family transporter [Planctomycetota bacterium]
MNWPEKAHLILPLIAAILFAFSALALKAASNKQAGIAGTTILANIGIMLGFSVFIDWSARPFIPDPFWPCVVLGVLFFLGQIFTMLSIARGAVSVATPVMSSKVVMVAFVLAFYYARPLGWTTWVAGLMVMLGIACMQSGTKDAAAGDRKRVLTAVICALLAAMSFAVYDVLTHVYSEQWKYEKVVPFGMAVCLLLSVTLVPFMEGSLRTLLTSKMLLLSVLLMTLQSLVIITSIGWFGDAANINIVYASRGIWSIALAWLLGSWFGVAEVSQPGVAVRRLLGATIILAAIVLVLL